MKFANVLVVSLLLAIFAVQAAAQSGGAPREPGKIRFRRVFVPEGTKDLPRDGTKYLPMAAGEFERLVEAAERTAGGLPAQSGAGLVQAEYEARLNGMALDGSATLDFSPAVASSVPMDLDPCNLAIRRAQWVTSDGAPAVLGTSGDGQLQVLAERGGQLKFDWSLAAKPASDGASFAIGLPPCPLGRLHVEVPNDSIVTSDRGIVSDEGHADAGFRRWKVELGGWPGCRLLVAKKASAESRREIFLASQTTTYELSLRGAEVTQQLDIDSRLNPLPKLTFEMEAPLDLIDAKAGERPLAWVAAPASEGKRKRITIEIPPSDQTGKMRIELRAVAPISMAEPWRLPRLSAEGIVARSSTVRLLVSSPLNIVALSPHGCRQTAVTPLKRIPGEALDFLAYDADAALDVTLVQRPADIRGTVATATLLGQGKMTSRVAADFVAAEGARFTLEAEVLPHWAIDAVESQPADALDDWTLEDRGGKPMLAVRLAHPLGPERPLRLIITARRLYAYPGRNLRIEDVVPLRFAPPVACRCLADLRAIGTNELRIKSGGTSCRADVHDLTAAEVDLFPERPGEFLFRDDAAAGDLRLSLEPHRPTFDATIRAEAIAGNRTLEESYTITCTPSKAAPIDRLSIHFSNRREAPVKWSIAGLDEGRFTARRWTAAQAATAGLAAEQEAWDISLRTPQTAPVELHGTRRSEFGGSLPLALVSLPDAAHQEATLTVRSFGQRALDIKSHRLTSLAVPEAPAGRMQDVRAFYRYVPSETASQAQPAIVVKAVEDKSPLAWVWDCGVRSRFAADGTAEHSIRYLIENAGRRQFVLKLPAPLVRQDVHGVWIDGQLATVFSASDTADSIAIDLPPEEKLVRLEVRLATRGDPLATFRRLDAPLPEVDLPLFSGHWDVELPPGFSTLSDHRGLQAGEAGASAFRERLLGGLSRSDAQAVFNPFRGNDWKNLFSGLQGGAESASRDGWSRADIDLTNRAAHVTMLYRPTIDASGWLVFLAVIGLGTWMRTGRPWLLLATAAFCGTCALVVPAALAAVLSRGLLAVGVCLLLRLVRRRPLPPTVEHSAQQEVPSTLTNVAPFAAPMMFLALLCAAPCRAAEPSKSASGTYSVFIPVNDKKEPSGSSYLVPESFFSELYRRSATHAEKPQGWMIVAAVYRAELTEAPSSPGHVVDRLAASYELHVFNPGARVRIPLRRGDASLVPDQAQLDGHPVQPDWDADGSALCLDVAEPGQYHLELVLQPSAPAGARGGSIDVTIPRVPGARLELAVPPNGPAIEVPSALGAVRWEEIPPRWTAEIGPADRLAVRWRETSAAAAEPPIVEQLQWLKVEPGCVLLDVKLKSKSAAAQLGRFRLQADPSLTLLPDSSAAAVPGSRDADGRQTFDCQMPPSRDAESALELRFVLTGNSSTGVIRAPQIGIVGVEAARHWLAVSVDRTLEYQASGPRQQDAAAISEFAGAWGAAEHPPDAVFRLNGNTADWSLTTRPRKPEIAADENIAWTFDPEGAQVELSARLSASGGEVFQWHVAAPPEMRVDSVAALVEGKKTDVRWWQQKDGRLTIFLSAPASKEQTLVVRGRLPIAFKRKTALPAVRIEDVRVQTAVLKLMQRGAVRVEIVAPPGFTEVKSPARDAAASDQVEPVRSFYVDPAEDNPLWVTLEAGMRPATAEAPIASPTPAAPLPAAAAGETRIAHAEVRIACQTDGRRVGAAVFDLGSPSASQYPLRLPEGYELLRLTVNGVPADAIPAGAGKWNVPLRTASRNVRVAMLYWSQAGSSPRADFVAGRTVLEAPRLGDLPIEKCIWVIVPPRGREVTSAESPSGPAAPITASHDRADEIFGPWREVAKNCGQGRSYLPSGRGESLTVNLAAVDAPAWPAQLMNTLFFLVTIFAVGLLLRRGLLGNWLEHWPYLAGVGFGLAWWLWASPSAAGLVIVMAVLARQALVAARLVRAV